MGKPTIKGTRVSVKLILELLVDGWSEKEILEGYPILKEKDLKAVYAYLKEKISKEFYSQLLQINENN